MHIRSRIFFDSCGCRTNDRYSIQIMKFMLVNWNLFCLCLVKFGGMVVAMVI